MERIGKITAALVVAIVGSAAGVRPLRGAAPAPTAGPKEPSAPLAGEYVGTFTSPAGKTVPAVAKVSPSWKQGTESPASYRVRLSAVASGLIAAAVIAPEAKVAARADLSGTPDGPRVALKGRGWSGAIAGGSLTATSKTGKFELKFTVRKSPTELAPPPAGATVLLPYKPGEPTKLDQWTNARWPVLTDGSAMARGGDNRTKRQYRNFRLHLEYRIPVRPRAGGNSGVYILGRYEIQILDSFAKGSYKGSCAAVYQTYPPTANACLPAGRWQTFDIEFFGPVMADGKAVKLPVATVADNGVTVHKNVEVPHATGNARRRGHGAPGPIRLQDHGCPVRFRNVWIEELPEAKRPSPAPVGKKPANERNR